MKSPIDYAQQLWTAHNTGTFCEPIPKSLTQDQAYAIQNACTDTAPNNDPVVGYKIGGTATETLGILGLDEPFSGPIYKSNYTAIEEQTAVITLPLYMQHKPRIEAEFVVTLKNDIRRTTKDITIEDLAKHIDWIAPGIEIVGSRFNDTPAHLGHRAIADLGANVAMIVGAPFKDWKTLDLSSYPVSLTMEGQPSVNGHSGMSIYGNPLHFVCWILNQPTMHNVGLKAGQFVSCGTCTGAPFLEAGKRTTVDYGQLGQIEIAIEAKG